MEFIGAIIRASSIVLPIAKVDTKVEEKRRQRRCAHKAAWGRDRAA